MKKLLMLLLLSSSFIGCSPVYAYEIAGLDITNGWKMDAIGMKYDLDLENQQRYMGDQDAVTVYGRAHYNKKHYLEAGVTREGLDHFGDAFNPDLSSSHEVGYIQYEYRFGD